MAHLGHIELLTPEPDASLRFFVDILGLTETGREGNSVYLRTWDDYEHHTLKLTAYDTSGIRRVGLRASSQAALETRVAAIEATGLGISWKETGSSCATRSPGWCWPRTGARSPGRRRSGPGARRGA